MLSRAIFLSLSTLLVLASAQRTRCGDFCTFHFCNANGFRTVFPEVGPRLNLRDAKVASQPFVCRKIDTNPRTFLNQTVRIIKTAQAEVHPAEDRDVSPRPFVPISKFNPPGLDTKFSKKYFSLREITRFPPIPGEKGISRLPSLGNQETFLDGLCVLLPIKSYNLLNEDLTLDKKIRRTNQREDCLSFESMAPKILIEFTWDSADDFDLSIKAPKREKINFNNQNSPSGGRLIGDRGVGRCGVPTIQDPVGREQIRWGGDSSPNAGKYVVTVKHFKNCGDGATKWSLAIIVNGKLASFTDGVSNKDNNKRVAKVRFNFP